MNFLYSEKTIPENYICSKCGKKHVKLWRQYQTMYYELLCSKCAAENQNKDVSTMNEDGMITGKFGSTDQIGWYVPAIPDEEGLGYWGYTSVPKEGVDWWRRLPNE